MRMGIFKMVTFILFFMVFSCFLPNADGAENKELTRGQLISRIDNIFNNNLDVASAITGLEAAEEESGTTYFYQGELLNKLDKDTLVELLRRADSQLSWKNLQKWEKQKRELKQIQDINKTQKELRQIRQTSRRK